MIEKKKLSHSGYFCRYDNRDTGKRENRCFEDMREAEQILQLCAMPKEEVIHVAIVMAETINKLTNNLMPEEW